MSELLFRENPYLAACDASVIAVHAGAVELDRTVFYPMGGGQPGDTGRIGAWRVLDARKGATPESVLHLLEPGFELKPGDSVKAEIDWERRHLHMRFHTALHLLCAAVRAPVTGGRIASDKARVNELVAGAHATQARWITDAELDERPELVRTMSVAPPRGEGRVRLLEIPNVDLQACGGTHVQNTAEIGPVAVARIRSEGKRNKRVTLVLR